MRKKIFCITILMACLSVVSHAQNLKGKYVNEEYHICLYLDVDNSTVKIPGDDIYGEVAGYFGSKDNDLKWLIIDCKRVSDDTAEISVINDYGSEDFTATLTEDNDGNITMKHLEGSPYKIYINSKRVKVPKTLILKKQK